MLGWNLSLWGLACAAFVLCCLVVVIWCGYVYRYALSMRVKSAKDGRDVFVKMDEDGKVRMERDEKES